jgi:hypothetical protein
MLLSPSESASGGMVLIRGSASGSVRKCHGFPTLVFFELYIFFAEVYPHPEVPYGIRGSRILRFIYIFFAEVYPRPDGTVYVCGSGGKTAPLPDNPANVEVDEEVCQMLEQVAVSASYKPDLLTVLRIRDVFPGSRILIISIPDPNFFHPGSEFFPSWIPDTNFFHSGSRIRIKEFKYFFNPKKLFLSSRKYDPGCSQPRSGS